VFVRFLFYTPLTPNHVTLLSTIVGCIAAILYLDGEQTQNIMAGACITIKDILDSADGQLARAKQQYSRMGRFLDSLGDILVNILVFGAIVFVLSQSVNPIAVVILGVAALAGITLRVSYHVFYQTSYLHLQDAYTVNRITEEVQQEDLSQDTLTLRLQSMFQLIYGWQDRLMLRIDEWCRGNLATSPDVDRMWYGDRIALRISGLMGLGTELFLLMAFSIANRLEFYLYVNVFVLNALWGAAIVYRRIVLRNRLVTASP
jgi:phosphatidylglycerophosphate synthase